MDGKVVQGGRRERAAAPPACPGVRLAPRPCEGARPPRARSRWNAQSFENDSTKPSGLRGVEGQAEATAAPDFQIARQVANATERCWDSNRRAGAAGGARERTRCSGSHPGLPARPGRLCTHSRLFSSRIPGQKLRRVRPSRRQEHPERTREAVRAAPAGEHPDRPRALRGSQSGPATCAPFTSRSPAPRCPQHFCFCAAAALRPPCPSCPPVRASQAPLEATSWEGSSRPDAPTALDHSFLTSFG